MGSVPAGLRQGPPNRGETSGDGPVDDLVTDAHHDTADHGGIDLDVHGHFATVDAGELAGQRVLLLLSELRGRGDNRHRLPLDLRSHPGERVDVVSGHALGPGDGLRGESLGDGRDLSVQDLAEEGALALRGGVPVRQCLLELGVSGHDAAESEELVLDRSELPLLLRGEQESLPAAPPQVHTMGALTDHPFFGRLFQACSALSEDFAGVYLVGGFVRDLLLEQPNVDVDIAVEGDGIEFATRLAAQLGGRVRAHRKFKTAVVLLPPEILGEAPAWLRTTNEPFHVDVATTRTEFYDYPAALPRVEHASIRQDLFRRDFTVNAMAISLRGRDLGTVIDFFGGYRDVRDGVIRVLHNLSFIEDPTRIFRAVRYENRYGFRMDEQTCGFAKSCVDMHLVGDLSSVRLRDELTALLSENDVTWTLGRLFELGVAREVHPKLATGAKTVALVRRLDEVVADLGLHDEVVSWRLRIAAMTRNMEHEELYIWLEQLKLKQSDSAVIRAAVVVGPLLPTSLAREDMTDWQVFKTLRQTPVEALVFALASTEPGPAEARVRRYLSDLRRRTLTIGGDDLLAMGVKKGPYVGRILERLREMRVEGLIEGQDQELEAARHMVEKKA